MKKKFTFLSIILAHIFGIVLIQSNSVQASSLKGIAIELNSDSPGMERSENEP